MARLLDHTLATAYSVREEVLVGKLPLRVDILLIHPATGELSEASRRDLTVLVVQQIECELSASVQNFGFFRGRVWPAVARHPGAQGAAEEVGGAAGLGWDGVGFFAPKGLQQISPGQSGAARAAQRRPGEEVVFNRLP